MPFILILLFLHAAYRARDLYRRPDSEGACVQLALSVLLFSVVLVGSVEDPTL